MLRLDDLLDFFDRGTIARSQSYVVDIRPERIRDVSYSDGMAFSATIYGARRYETTVAYDESGILNAYCSCPVGNACKHAAALVQAAFRANLLPLGGGRMAPFEGAQKITLTAQERSAKEWMSQLSNTAKELSNQMHLTSNHLDKTSPFIYILQPLASYSPRELNVVMQRVRRLKDGSIAAAKSWSEYYKADYDDKVPALDRRLIGALHAQQRANISPMLFGRMQINGFPMQYLLEIAQTGRFYWLNHHERSIQWQDESYTLDFIWTENTGADTAKLKTVWRDGSDTIINVADELMYHIPSEPPAYFDSRTGHMGPLQTRYPQTLLNTLLDAPNIPLSLANELESMLDALPNDMALPAPQAMARPEHAGICRPVLVTQTPPHWWRPNEADAVHGFAKVMFDYDGGTVAYTQSGESFKGTVDGVKVTQLRDRAFERDAIEALLTQMPDLRVSEFRMQDGESRPFVDVLNAPFEWWFAALTQPEFFEDIGWRVRHAPNSPLNIHRASAPEVALSEHAQEGNDWFSLGMHIEANGLRYNLSDLLGSLVEAQPTLLDAQKMALIDDDVYLFALANNGVKIALRMGDVRPILTHLADLFGQASSDGQVKLDRYDAMRLLELQHTLGLAYSGSSKLQKLIDAFRNGHETQLAAPKGFAGTLRPYQEKGLAWLQFLRESEHGGILADDMGLGKTAQALAHILTEKIAGRLDLPVLIVAPTSLMHNWRTEAARFTPELKVLVLQGMARFELFESINAHDVVLTTYPLLPRDEQVLLEHQYHMVILDEAQTIKNPVAKATQVARKLDTRHRLCLTGTPMENHLGELWSLYHFLMPGFLGSQESFNKRFRNPIEKQGSSAARSALTARARTFMLRRRKTEVATELPPKTTTVVQIDMGSTQQKLYEAIRAAMQAKVQLQIAQKGFKRSHIEILDALLKLRQVCCHPSLLKLDSVKKDVESAKLKALLEMVVEMVAEGRRILIFSQFTSMLSLIEAALIERKIDLVKLTGQTKQRAEVIDAFQNGDIPVFLISLKAGGVGLNLTAADTVIHYDPWWNPAAEEQASDRAWRIGQDKPVFVYKLIIAGSIEEKIIEMQQRKAALTNSVLSEDNEQTVKFSEDDLVNLLAPIG